MDIQEKEFTKKEKVYELTESELKTIIENSYNLSFNHLSDYIFFCKDNYYYKLNWIGTVDFLTYLLDFLNNGNYIKNNHNNLEYFDYLMKNNYYCPWDLKNLDKLLKGELKYD